MAWRSFDAAGSRTDALALAVQDVRGHLARTGPAEPGCSDSCNKACNARGQAEAQGRGVIRDL
ncbi:hypothetical protein [Streptomyces ochraceiscleroticus]|uniref:Uncharacterized protein n=1 Tax=Streptomyces ochraceiscleroticus TaxID=47761 RepID=A0ABW1MIW1_9ACTN